MGCCWSCASASWKSVIAKTKPPGSSSHPAPISSSVRPPGQPPPSSPIHDSDTALSPVGHLSDGESSFLGTNVSRNSRFSMATTNLTTWMSQASGAIAALWNVVDDNEFAAATAGDDALPDWEIDSKLKAFSYAELEAATSNFKINRVMGRGGFGSVYKGWLNERATSQDTRRRPIAVKKLDSTSKQGYRQWRTEIGFLRRLSHENIVRILGYCKENEELLIVYEFMPKGSLNYHLFGRRSGQSLPWEVRIKIAIGMARGLSYLHSSMEKPIIFRDFKSSNVLLDESYNPKISDFGLAKWGPSDGRSHVTGHVVGTVGYAAPEYTTGGNLYVKSDVYSYGVVLVEMLTGLRAIDKRRPPGQRSLVDWTRSSLSDKLKLRKIMDQRLDGRYAPGQASAMAVLALRCLQVQPEFRPSMMEIADTLQEIESKSHN